jgi:hypothetical protein
LSGPSQTIPAKKLLTEKASSQHTLNNYLAPLQSPLRPTNDEVTDLTESSEKVEVDVTDLIDDDHGGGWTKVGRDRTARDWLLNLSAAKLGEGALQEIVAPAAAPAPAPAPAPARLHPQLDGGLVEWLFLVRPREPFVFTPFLTSLFPLAPHPLCHTPSATGGPKLGEAAM